MAEQLIRSNRLVTVFGGSGFVGRHVVRALARDGWRVRVASRRPDLAFHLQPAGKVGQINAVQANLRYPASVAAAVRGADAVVNLVGILRPTGAQRFDAVHVFGARAVARAARDAGIVKFVQMSALGVDSAHAAVYARTKAAAEAAVHDAVPEAVILRPSVVFGPEDRFFNRFAALARVMPALPLIGGGTARLQPVFVGDVARMVACALDGTLTAGATYELGGPEVSTMREIFAFVLAVTERKRLLLPVPFPAAKIMGGVTETIASLTFGFFPEDFVMTGDQVELLRHDNVVSAAAVAAGRTLTGVGIVPESYETFVPTYLYRFRKTGQFAAQRES
jgi:NADH dehydrogenase